MALMPINWLLESMKWKSIMQTQRAISFKEAFYSILSGITLGIITPARIGEYVGRSLIVYDASKSMSYFSTFLCSISQNLINILVGIAAVLFFINESYLDINTHYLIGVNVIILIIGLTVYFKIFAIIKGLRRINFFKNKLEKLDFARLDFFILSKVLLFSSLRYLVYVTQFIFALRVFELETTLPSYIKSIATIFFIQSSIPIPPIMDLFARGEIAVVVFQPIGFSMIQVLMASALLWVINLIIPALIGWLLIMRINLLKSVGYGKA